MNLQLQPINKNQFPAVLSVWETSVRATHQFLTENDIQFYKQLLGGDVLESIPLTGAFSSTGELQGFIGVLDQKIEMLFVHPTAMGKGIGKLLTQYAFDQLNATSVDVNEQNPKAVQFYLRMGFTIIGRSALDGMGKPFPLLHLEKSNSVK